MNGWMLDVDSTLCMCRKNPERTANRGSVVLTLMVRLVKVMQRKAVQVEQNNPKHEADVKQTRRDGKKQKFAQWNAKKAWLHNKRIDREGDRSTDSHFSKLTRHGCGQ